MFSFLQANSSTADLTTYTFSGENLGTAAADRYIIVVVKSRDSGSGAKSISSVTIGGVTASIIIQKQNNASNSSLAGIAIAAVPTGTTGDVVVTFSEGMLRCAIGLYRATGITPIPADFGSSTATNPTYAIDVPAGGFAIGGVANSNGNDGSAVWTGLTERYDSVIEAVMLSTGASDEFAAAQTNLTVTATLSGTNTEPVGVFASWGLSTKTAALNPTEDGWAGTQESTGLTPAAFGTVRGGNGNINRDQGTSTAEHIYLRCHTTTNFFDLMRRALFSFDLSTIPTGATITAVRFRLYANTISQTLTGQALTLTNGGPAANDDIVNSDFEGNLNNNTQYGDSLSFASLVAGAYNTWNLNAAGIAALQAAIGGYFKMQLKYECDRTNSAPTWSSGAEASMNWSFGNATSNKSQIYIEYYVSPIKKIIGASRANIKKTMSFTHITAVKKFLGISNF